MDLDSRQHLAPGRRARARLARRLVSHRARGGTHRGAPGSRGCAPHARSNLFRFPESGRSEARPAKYLRTPSGELDMTPEELRDVLAFLESTPGRVSNIAKEIPEARHRWKPSKDEFSVLEQFCH